jgi:hypothetical protein
MSIRGDLFNLGFENLPRWMRRCHFESDQVSGDFCRAEPTAHASSLAIKERDVFIRGFRGERHDG